MKYKRLLSFLLVFVLLSISCNLLTSNNSNKSDDSGNTTAPGDLPVIDFEAQTEPLNVTVELDETSTISGKFSPSGSSMSLTAGDGAVFTLEVPAGALDVDTVITMTAVKSIDGAPLSDGPVAAVQLEPSGLFFKEIVTLTIIPAQEIPIENQIIFGYEGNGQDYHLAVVDPNSREIKVKLMQFSGAGVGSGGDIAWAANLQVQASDASARISHKVGELLQNERQAQLLGLEGNPDMWKDIKSYMDQYYDQVIQKEIVAAELDCKYARKAIQDLLALERQNQLLGLSTDSNGEIIPVVNDLWGKIDKLVKIGEKCRKSYSISGGADEFFGTGTICDIEKPWIISGSGVTMTFTPSSANGGTYAYSGSISDIAVSGSGNYTVSYQGDIAVSIQAGGSGTASDATGSGDENYKLTPLSEGSCQ